MQSRRELCLSQHVEAAVARWTVCPKSNVDAGGQGKRHGKVTGEAPAVANWAMRNTGTGDREGDEILCVELAAVRRHEIWAEEPAFAEILDRRLAVVLPQPYDLLLAFSQMCVEAKSVLVGGISRGPAPAPGRPYMARVERSLS